MKRDGLLVWMGCVLLFLAGAVWRGALPSTDFFKIADIHDLTEIFAAMATIFAVAYGVTAWKKQLRGQSDHELARRLLLETENLKAQILTITKTAENCLASTNLHSADFKFFQEILGILKADLINGKECRNRMEVLLVEADVIWGAELRTYYVEVYDLFDLCAYCINAHLDFLNDPDVDDGDDLVWIDYRLSEGGWNLDEQQRRMNVTTLVSNATAYLKDKLAM